MRNKEQKKRISPVKMVFLILVRIVLLVLALAVGLVGVLTIGEYRPDDVETIISSGGVDEAQADLPAGGDQIRVVTWNIGYGALGDNDDFFMDGGKGVITADLDRVNENMDAIISGLS